MEGNATSDDGGGYVSPCWEPDGSFNAVCIVVISVGVVVAVVTVFCILQVTKLCMKLKTDKVKVDEEREMKLLKTEKTTDAAEADDSNASSSRQEEATVTNVDGIHTIETSFVSSTAV